MDGLILTYIVIIHTIHFIVIIRVYLYPLLYINHNPISSNMNTTTPTKSFEAIQPYEVLKNVTLTGCKPFNLWLTPDHNEWIEQVYTDCFPLSKTKKHRATFELVVSNLAFSDLPMSISIDKSRYRWLKHKPKLFTPTNLSEICRSLDKKGYIDMHKGYGSPEGIKVPTTLHREGKLVELIPDDLRCSIHWDGLIIPKKFDPPEVYPDHVQEAQEVLFNYNSMVEPQNMLYATYKGGFYVNGRFTGSQVICMKRELRPSIKIDIQKTFELDIRNCLASLLYASELGRPFDGDAYDLPGTPRDVSKMAMLVALNCNSRKAAQRPLQNYINLKYPKMYKAADILDALERLHKPILKHLYREQGLSLMNLEARCMCRFLKEMVDSNIKVYPIYDSVIGKISDRDFIHENFTEAFTVNRVAPAVH